MKDSQKARVFGILFVLASVFVLSGQVARAQSGDRLDRTARDTVTQSQSASGGDIVCIVFSSLTGQGVPIPVLTASGCSDQGGHVSACSDGIDNDGDGLIDAADPSCHSDGNAANGATYVSALDDESATTGSGPGDPSVPQCMDGRDNDSDGLIDAADPGCHSDGIATNTASYISGDNSEADSVPPENSLALCADGIDNDGNGAADLADPSCAAFAPTVTVTATVSNTHGGTASTSDMMLFLDGTSTDSGVVATTTPGVHAVTATTTATSTAYQVAFGGDCDSAGHVTLAIGEHKACSVDFSDVATTTGSGGNDTGSGGTSGNTGGGGGGGGNGPVAGSLASFGGGGGGGPVLFGAVASTSACDTYLTSFIRYGGANDPAQVSRLQTVLRNEGANVAVSGDFDLPTLVAVRALQQKYASEILAPWGLTQPTGYVFLTTRKKINEIYCRNTTSFPLTAAEQAVVAAGATSPAPLIRTPQKTQGVQTPIPTPAATQTDIEQTAREAQAGAAAAPVQAPGFFENIRNIFGRFFWRFR